MDQEKKKHIQLLSSSWFVGSNMLYRRQSLQQQRYRFADYRALKNPLSWVRPAELFLREAKSFTFAIFGLKLYAT